MRRAFWRSLAIAAAAALFASCILITDPAGDDPGWRNAPDREPRTSSSPPPSTGPQFRKTVDLPPGGTLSLENDYGDVAIIGWERDAVEVVAQSPAAEPERYASARQGVRTGYGPAPRVEVRETGRGLLVRTPTYEGPGRPPAVRFDVRVPHSFDLTGVRISEGDLAIEDVYGRLDVSVDAGALTVRNFSGTVRAAVGTGGADVEVLDLREGDEISVTARQGDITLRLEPGAGAIVEADAPRGRVNSDFDLGRALPATTVKGWIGQGGPTILLRASNGSIRIVKTAGGPASSPAPDK